MVSHSQFFLELPPQVPDDLVGILNTLAPLGQHLRVERSVSDPWQFTAGPLSVELLGSARVESASGAQVLQVETVNGAQLALCLCLCLLALRREVLLQWQLFK